MPATFYFRAVASDGKVRTGKLGGETDKAVARELRKQGLMPVYVGAAPLLTRSSCRPSREAAGGTFCFSPRSSRRY